MATKLPNKDDIAAHAQKLLNEKIADGTLVPDAAAAVTAATVPSFSQGTIALDENTGRPVVPADLAKPPEAAASAGQEPAAAAPAIAPTDADAGAAAEAAAAGRAEPAAPVERDDKGKFVAAKPPEQRAADPEAAGAQAADAAAQAVIDDWDDLEFEDDSGNKYPVRAKKGQTDAVKNFAVRRSQRDRASTFLGRWKPTLEPLITSGQMEQILPLMQRALQDAEFGEAVVDLYNRRVQGRALRDATPPAAPAPAAQVAAPAAETGYGLDADPFLAEALRPFASKLDQIAANQARYDQERAAQMQREQQQQRLNSERAAQIAAAHGDIAARYPSIYSGNYDRDKNLLDPVFRYARESGLANTYGVRAAIVLAADALAQERAETGSPAAALIQQVDRATMEAAQAQARGARTVGGGAPAQPARRPAPVAPSPRRADGSLKSTKEFMDEQQRYAQAVVGA